MARPAADSGRAGGFGAGVPGGARGDGKARVWDRDSDVPVTTIAAGANLTDSDDDSVPVRFPALPEAPGTSRTATVLTRPTLSPSLRWTASLSPSLAAKTARYTPGPDYRHPAGYPHRLRPDLEPHGTRPSPRVWDLATAGWQATLAGHTGPVRAVACNLVAGQPAAVTASSDSLPAGDPPGLRTHDQLLGDCDLILLPKPRRKTSLRERAAGRATSWPPRSSGFSPSGDQQASGG